MSRSFAVLLSTCIALVPLLANAQTAPTLRPDGTVLLGPRSIPLAATLSPEARAAMAQPPFPDLPLPQMRAFMRELGVKNGPTLQAVYKVKSESATLGGVKITILTPANVPAANRDRVLLHIHGGGFSLCDGPCSYMEAIPIAGLTQTKIVSVDYSLAPEHPFPTAMNEALTIYKDLLKTYKPERIGIFGSSAGAVLSAEVVAKIKQQALPMPAALGFFSGVADMARMGDSQSLYDARGFSDPTAPQSAGYYLGSTPPTDPIASPIYSDLRGFPSTLLMTSTRDLFLSGTSNFERALHAAGVATELVTYDGLNHTFWLAPTTPEAREALARQAQFLDRELNRGGRSSR